jgi:hypothetical protein
MEFQLITVGTPVLVKHEVGKSYVWREGEVVQADNDDFTIAYSDGEFNSLGDKVFTAQSVSQSMR